MTDLNELLKQLPIAEIAKKVGVDEDTAEDAVKQVLPGLVGGLSANASSGGGASLEKALGKHHGASTAVADVDTDDGEKIVKNVFGSNKDAVASKLAEASPKSNVTQDLIAKVLPIVAPIVLAWLANQFFSKKPEAAATKESKAEAGSNTSSGGGGIGDILGGLLGGGGSSSGSGSGGGGLDIGGILGGLLGGGKK